MGSIISIANHKGGVGKTTTAANLGVALTLKGKRVLLVDLDAQANLTQSLGAETDGGTTYDALREKKVTPWEYKKGLDLIPSTLDLSGAEMELVGEAGREFIFREALAPLARKYDFVLVNCPPSLGLLTFNALAASKEVIIPLQTQFLAVQGLAKITHILGKVKSRLNEKMGAGRILLTQFDARKNLHRGVIESIKKQFKGQVFKTKIRDNVSIGEAPMQRQDILTYAPRSHGAEDYKALGREFLKWCK